jgi:hypothetical protein
MLFIRGIRWRCVFVVVSGLTLVGHVRAAESVELQSMVGAWDLNLEATNRQCRIILRREAAAVGYSLAVPAGCRRALPVLADINSWSKDAGSLTLTDAAGRPILQFARGQDGILMAAGPENQTYSLVPTDPRRKTQLAAMTVASPSFNPPATLPAVQVAQAAANERPISAAVKPTEMPGRYSLFREGPKDTGCMLTLDDKARGPKGSLKAVLSPACRDQGIVIFDPTGWTVERSRLVLTARKGHQAHFDRQGDGSWSKDPKDGKGLILRKM